MRHWRQRFRLFALLMLCTAPLPASAQSSDPAAQLFKGKTLKLVIPTGAGGAYGLYGLLFAQHFGKHLPGNPAVLPEYRPGAGGMIAANYLYSVAPHDGSVIGIPLAPIILAKYTGGASAQYDVSKFLWIGRMANITRLLTVWHTSKVMKFEDLAHEESVAGTTGKGSETFINPALINHVFAAKMKIVSGYKGSAALMHALEQGEISVVSATWGNVEGNHADWMRDGKVRFVAQIGTAKLPQLPNVPLLADLAKNDADRQVIEFMSLVTSSVGYSVMAPPGVPDPIVDAMRKAFDATMQDPAFIADAKKRRADLDPADYKAVQADVNKAVNSPPQVFQRFMTALQASK